MSYWTDLFGAAVPMKEIHTEAVVISETSDDVIFGSGATGVARTYTKDGRNVFDTQHGAIMTMSAYVQGPNGTVFDPTIVADDEDKASIADELARYIDGLRIYVIRGAHTMEQHIGEEILPLMPMRFATNRGLALYDQNNGSILQGGEKRIISWVNQTMPFGLIVKGDVVKFKLEYTWRPEATSPLIGSRIKYILSTVKASGEFQAQALSSQAI